MKLGKSSVHRIPGFRYIGILLFGGALFLLAYSVARSGMGYMYDADEIARVQESYLIANGSMPFRDYYTIYSPIFPILLLPVFFLQGFTFYAIDTARFFMTALFFFRVGLTAYLAYLLMGKRAAALFAAFLLLDPFTVFTSMQIRADNVMVLVLTAGIVFLVQAIRKDSRRMAGIAGGLLILSFCIMVKAFLTIFAVGAIFLLFAYLHKRVPLALSFVMGGCIVLVLYLLPFLLTGTFGAMLQQSVMDPKAFQSTQDYPTPLGYFYRDGNWNLFGAGGRSFQWAYAWILPLLAFAGAYQAGLTVLSGREKRKGDIIIPALGISLVLQWALLLTLHTVLIQYYIPFLWLFALFAAWAVEQVLAATDRIPVWKQAVPAGLLIFFIYATNINYQGNILRSHLDSRDFVTSTTRIWEYIPPNAKVFPMALFRPYTYPLAEGYFAGVHSGLLGRYDPVETYLEKDQTPFILASDYDIGYLQPATQTYIRSKYAMLDSGLNLMIRKGSEQLSGQQRSN